MKEQNNGLKNSVNNLEMENIDLKRKIKQTETKLEKLEKDMKNVMKIL